MKRNMDLVRAILLEIEEKDLGNGYHKTPKIPEFSHEEVRYHCKIMDEAGLIRYRAVSGGNFIVSAMTWSGHEFIALSANPEVWKKTKKTLLDKGLDFTFDLGVKLLTKFTDELLSGI